MKKILISSLFLAFFSAGIVDAQAVLSVVPKSLTVFPDTFIVGKKISLNVIIKNTGKSAFNDPGIYIYYRTLANSTPRLLTTLNDTNGILIDTGKTLSVNDMLLLTDTIYFPRDTNKNIIVVWPTGIGVSGNTDPNVSYSPGSAMVAYNFPDNRTSILQPTDENAEKAVKVYPNPAVDEFYIQCLNPATTIKTVQIIDIAGKQITDWSMDDNEINITNLPKGIYLISITVSDNNIARYKIIKQ